MIVEQHTLTIMEMLVLRARLRLEIAGMSGRGPTALSRLRKHGYRGQRLKVLADLCRDIDATSAAFEKLADLKQAVL
jgi:hypothetical protein